jgi:hypothetical protein
MKNIVFIIMLSLFSVPTISCENNNLQIGPCEQGPMQLYLPEKRAAVTKNIHIEAVEYTSEENAIPQKKSSEITNEILKKINDIAIKELSNSKNNIEVKVRYTISSNKPIEFEMQKRAGSESDTMLNKFYDRAAEININNPGFKIQIVFHYKISAV